MATNARLLEKNAPLLARIAATYEADPALQEDLVQDMSLAVWRAMDSFRGDASEKTFIARIAHNRAVDHVLRERRHHERYSPNEASDFADAANSAKQQDAAFDLMTALHQLPINYRQVMTLQLEGFSHAEIGLVLGLNETAVSQRARRARLQLEKIINRN